MGIGLRLHTSLLGLKFGTPKGKRIECLPACRDYRLMARECLRRTGPRKRARIGTVRPGQGFMPLSLLLPTRSGPITLDGMRRIAIIVVPLVVVAIGVIVWSQQRRGPSFVSGMIEADEIRAGSRVGGRVQQVHVREGELVHAGDPLVTLEPFDLRERLAEARAQLAARQAERDRLRSGFRREEVAQARARRDRLQANLERWVAGPRPLELQILRDKLAVAQAELTRAEDEFERVQRLYEQQTAAQQQLDDVTATLSAARSRFAQAQDELKLGEEGTRAELIAEARAQLAEAEAALALQERGFRQEEVAQAEALVESAAAQVQTIERQLEELTIRAPGTVRVEAIDLQPGDLIAPSAPVLTLVDPANLWVRAYVPANLRPVGLDEAVRIRADSIPNKTFRGRVVFVARQAEFTPNNTQTTEERAKLVFRVKIRLEEGTERLHPGMAVDVLLGDAE